MPHQNSVFHSLLNHVPWGVFQRLVREHQADWRVRRLSTKSQFIAMLYGQLAGANSLREVVDGLASHRTRLYHLGGRTVARSSLSDANARRSAEVFSTLFAHLAGQAHRKLRREAREATYLIDASVLPLNRGSSGWSHFSAKFAGAKMHVIYDAEADQPIYSALTPARVNDITVAQKMPIEPGATYVFDLGYYDYRWWAELHAAGCRIVTRLRNSTPLRITHTHEVTADHILSDRVGYLPSRQASNRRNPMNKPLREVRVRLETGKILRIVSNDLNASAENIADLYKRRWAIELFFRWVKQRLRIRHFMGTSENAVRIQIAVAMIAYILIRLAQNNQTHIRSPLTFARVVRANLMHRKHLDRLLSPQPDPHPTQHPNQYHLLTTPT